jgi:threonine dehydrogenase-like Zn-dependent dehydrogenase
MLRHNGAAQVTVVDRAKDRLHLAQELGASHIVLADAGQDVDLQEICPVGFDFVIDATGVPDVVEGAFRYLRPRGTMFFFGVCPTHAQIRIAPYDVFRNDWHIIGSFALCYTFHEAINLLQNGVVQVEPLVSHRLSLEGAAEAFTTIQQDPSRMKVLIEPN